MAIEKTLCAQKREGAGKGVAHRLRAQSLVPGVFYNRKGENINVQVPSLPLEQLYFEIGNTTVFNLEIDDNGKKTTYPCFFWDVQKHMLQRIRLYRLHLMDWAWVSDLRVQLQFLVQ